MKGSMLKFIEMVREANSEEDVTSLMDLMNPTDDAEEMGGKYNEVLGYNPITYFDEVKVRDIINEVSSEYPNVKFNTEEIVKHADELIDVHKEYGIIQSVFYDVKDALITSGHNDESDEMDSAIISIIANKLGTDNEYVAEILEIGYSDYNDNISEDEDDDYDEPDDDFDDEDE